LFNNSHSQGYERVLSKILVVSRDPQLADVRKNALEDAGYAVIAATSERPIDEICTRERPKLVLIRYSLKPAAKRRVWDQARKRCNVPILELHRKGVNGRQN
jgi:DNA-binding response OmpR family regulator